jgi:hypothetical protein
VHESGYRERGGIVDVAACHSPSVIKTGRAVKLIRPAACEKPFV